MGTKICKRCHLEAEERKARAGLSAYVARMEADIRAEEQLYSRRLALCRSCEKQVNDLCMVCGCFIEVRAAVKEQYCPMPERRW